VTVATVQVRVPGSTSNVGAGFDCVGIAIDRRLSAAVRLEQGGAPVRIDRRGTLQAVTVPADRDSLFAGFVAACRGAGCKVPGGVVIDATSEIPIGRGLGSSGAATVAGALAARALLGLELDDAALARLCADVEHHPDNVAPAIYGGAVLAVPGPEGRLTVAPLDVHASLASFIQHDNADHSIGINTRLRYNFREGRDLWIVYNETLNTDRPELPLPQPPFTRLRAFVVKYTHTMGL